MTVPPAPKRRHPIGQVPKTMADLKAYEETHKTEEDPEPVAVGIWYEVAIKEYLAKRFSAGMGATISLYDWGSIEDQIGRDGLIKIPAPISASYSIDFTTDPSKKTSLCFPVDKRWFKDEKENLIVVPKRKIEVTDDDSGAVELIAVEDHIDRTFLRWLRLIGGQRIERLLGN